jgi:8-oxo-dGTP pyrophosphatase MutT (NUDIX family)
MEDSDSKDFVTCGLREFKEETGLDISNSYEKLSKEKIKRGFKFTHFSSSKSKLKMFFIKNKVDYSKSISMYYLVKIE